MKRRRGKSSVGASLDSLLDTLTNVVGILVIVLIVTQLGVGQAVERIKGFVEEISVEELQAAAKEADEFQKLLEEHSQDVEEQDKQEPQRILNLEEQRKLIEQMKAQLSELSKSTVDPDKVLKLAEQRKKRVEQLLAQINSAEDQLAKLKARLDSTPQRGPDPRAKVVNLPNPRGAPAGATPAIFFCRYGRIVPVGESQLRRLAQSVMERAAKKLAEKGGINCKKLVAFFNEKKIGNEYIRCKIRVSGPTPYLLLTSKEGAGIPTGRVGSVTSKFRTMIRRIDKTKKYIQIYVWPDSYDTYLAARGVISRFGLTAGWVPYYATSEYSTNFKFKGKIVCSDYKPPPPRPKPKTPAPPKRRPPPSKLPPAVKRPLPPDVVD